MSNVFENVAKKMLVLLERPKIPNPLNNTTLNVFENMAKMSHPLNNTTLNVFVNMAKIPHPKQQYIECF